MIKRLPLLLFICLISLPAVSYTIKQGDTLANIVRRFYTGPVFGKNGGVAQLLSINPFIKTPDYVLPGIVIKLNKKLLRPGITDDVAPTDEDLREEVAEVIEQEVNSKPESEEATQEYNPPVEVEKYDEAAANLLKGKAQDKINLFLAFKFNSFTAKDRVTFNSFKFNTSSETEIGAEYVKYISEKTTVYGSLALNQFTMPEVLTLTPTLDASSKSQVSASVGGQYLFTDANFIGLSVNYSPHYYLNQNNLGHLELAHSPSASFAFDTENQFYQNEDFILGLNFGFETITNPQNVGTGAASGVGFNLGFIYQQEFKSNDKLRVKFNYSQTSLDTTLYSLTDNVMAINFLYSLPY